MPLVFPTGQSKSIIVCRYALARRELPIEDLAWSIIGKIISPWLLNE